MHGFLALRTLDGRTIADGDLSQVVKGGQVTARIVFRFHDGSRHEETRQLDMSIDAGSGQVTARYSDDDGGPKTESERLELPAALANGLVSTLLENVRPAAPPTVSPSPAWPSPTKVTDSRTDKSRTEKKK